jgi:hypothetical protein
MHFVSSEGPRTHWTEVVGILEAPPSLVQAGFSEYSRCSNPIRENVVPVPITSLKGMQWDAVRSVL